MSISLFMRTSAVADDGLALRRSKRAKRRLYASSETRLERDGSRLNR
jgi:hypothetical protein